MVIPLPRATTRSLVIAVVVLPVTAGAQRATTSLDVGGATMRYADSVDATAAVLASALRLQWARATVGLNGSLSQLGQQGWTSQASAAGSAFSRAMGLLAGEVAVLAGGSAHQDGGRTSQLLGSLRAHVSGSSAGVWLGGGVGQMYDGFIWRNVHLVDGGAWVRAGGTTLVGLATPTVVADSIRYTDVQGTLAAGTGRVEFAATAGTRSGAQLPTLGGATTTWGSVSLVAWLAARAALVVSAGTYPVDLTQGFPGGRFATLSVRLGSRPRLLSRNGEDSGAGARAAVERERAARSGILAFALSRMSGGRVVLRVRAPSAASVELMGDFTAWQPEACTRAADGWWTFEVALAQGVHEVNVRTDGGPWVAPPGLLTMADEFGGAVGLLVIEGSR